METNTYFEYHNTVWTSKIITITKRKTTLETLKHNKNYHGILKFGIYYSGNIILFKLFWFLESIGHEYVCNKIAGLRYLSKISSINWTTRWTTSTYNISL